MTETRIIGFASQSLKICCLKDGKRIAKGDVVKPRCNESFSIEPFKLLRLHVLACVALFVPKHDDAFGFRKCARNGRVALLASYN